MDTTWEEPGSSSQWELLTSPIEKGNLLCTESTPSINPSYNVLNTPGISPFTLLTSKLAPCPSILTTQNINDSTSNESSDLEEESLDRDKNLCSNQDNKNHCRTVVLNHPISSQGSSSSFSLFSSQDSSTTFSPFSSPVSSSRPEAPKNKLNTTRKVRSLRISPISKTSISCADGEMKMPSTTLPVPEVEAPTIQKDAQPEALVIEPTELAKEHFTPIVQSTSPVAITQRRFQSCAKLGRSRNAHLIEKIIGRELTGVVRKNPTNPRDPYVRLVSRLPKRLAFCLRDVIPQSAIEDGHIFMGFSKCGQFLLSYTQSEADFDLVTLVPNFHYQYRLHWWLFVPYRKAKKVAEVTLFSNTSAAGNLHITFCQWPKDNKKVLILGCQMDANNDFMYSNAASEVLSRLCYITVTAIPSLNACRECVKVAASYKEDEMAAEWNSSVRPSCLDHGMTVHTSFDLVRPYPKFEPRVSMKRDSWVLINSGNFLHAMHFKLEELKPKDSSVYFCFPTPLPQTQLQVAPERCIANAAHKAYELTDDSFKEDSVQEKLSSFRKKRLAEKKYEFIDEKSENISLHKLMEQHPNIKKQEMNPSEKTLDNCDSDEEKNASKTLNAESLMEVSDNGISEAKLLEYVPIPEILSPGGIMTKKEPSSCSSSVINASPRSQHGTGYNEKEPLKFHARFTRRFIEMDDEMVSVMSGIELDDDEGIGSQTGYHSALPLEVHGSGYQAMAMISNAKAEKLNAKCCKVAQYSMDVELFCHTMAQKLCAAAGKKYWFCNDYDVELVDIDPDSGDVICVAVVLVTATVVTKTVSQNCQKLSMISSLQRHLHQGGFHFCWNMDTGECRLIDMDSLKELQKEPIGIWHPAKNISTTMQRTWGVLMPNTGAGNVRCFTNDSVIRGTSLKTIVDPDHLVAIILDDLE